MLLVNRVSGLGAGLARIIHDPSAAIVYLTPSPELFYAASAARLLQGSRCFPGLILIADLYVFQYYCARLTALSPGSDASYTISLQWS